MLGPLHQVGPPELGSSVGQYSGDLGIPRRQFPRRLRARQGTGQVAILQGEFGAKHPGHTFVLVIVCPLDRVIIGGRRLCVAAEAFQKLTFGHQQRAVRSRVGLLAVQESERISGRRACHRGRSQRASRISAIGRPQQIAHHRGGKIRQSFFVVAQGRPSEPTVK